MDQGGYSFDQAERRLLDGATDELPALSIAKRSADVLARLVEGTQIPPLPPEQPAWYFVRSATFVLAVIGLRTARACMLVVSAGYGPEAHGLKRRLSEVHARAQAVANDTSGQHARDWLDEKGPSTPPKIVGKWGSADLWEIYGWGAHADARSVHRWLSIPVPEVHEGHRAVLVAPHHQERLSNALLVEIATECRDMAMAQAVARSATREEIQRRLDPVHSLDPDIEAAIERWYAPEDRPAADTE